MNKGSIVERLCSDLIAKNHLLYFTLLYFRQLAQLLTKKLIASATCMRTCAVNDTVVVLSLGNRAMPL